MKKIFAIIFLLSFSSTFALGNDTEIKDLTRIPLDFNSDCFEYYTKVYKNSFEKDNIYKVNSNKPIDYITQNGYILPKKDFSNKISNLEYNSNSKLDFSILNDDNYKTFGELDFEGKESILLTLKEKTKIGGFSFVFDYTSSFYFPNYYISDDNISFSKVDKSNIEDFGFKYLKIEFLPNNSLENTREKIQINELSFLNNNRIYLVKPLFDDSIEIYYKNNCKDNLYINEKEQDFGVNKNTKEINIKLDENSSYNPNSIKDDDLDNDFIPNSSDNCQNIYNPDQLDSNSDLIGDACSDIDNDGIIGNVDNCPNISNTDQKDVNRNGVGDVCEFDKDKDGVFDLLDNCVTTPNPDQKDDDNDRIGNSCDNCKYYNPDQRDENQNKIGDYCEQKEQELKDNDKDKDGIIDFQDNCTVPIGRLNLKTGEFYQGNSDKFPIVSDPKADIKKYFNPKQEDGDQDGVGDVCDNCSKLQNSDQKDENKNSVGDMCEDVDLDSIEGYLDNCPNISNVDQKDDDNNGVGNVCEDSDSDGIVFVNDNCPFVYNIDQKDIDSDKIGDSCDKKDDRFVESNSNFFIGLIVLVTLAFFVGIYKTVKSLGNKE